MTRGQWSATCRWLEASFDAVVSPRTNSIRSYQRAVTCTTWARSTKCYVSPSEMHTRMVANVLPPHAMPSPTTTARRVVESRGVPGSSAPTTAIPSIKIKTDQDENHEYDEKSEEDGDEQNGQYDHENKFPDMPCIIRVYRDK